MKQIFSKDKVYCIVEKDNDEILEHFIERGYFIVAQKPKNIIDYNKIYVYSKIWINNKYFNCKYSADVLSQLKKYLINLK